MGLAVERPGGGSAPRLAEGQQEVGVAVVKGTAGEAGCQPEPEEA